MDNIERRDKELAYISDAAVMAEQAKCRKILQKLNFTDRSDFAGIAEVVKELQGGTEGAFINPPFYCDYGSHIEVGKNFFANYNCTIIDVAKVKIGDNCQLAPNVSIYTAGNPCRVKRAITDADKRKLNKDEEIDEAAWKDIMECGFFGEGTE